jgi:antitoxin FitA
MSRTITIRNVPDEVADVLSSRAKDGGRSLQAYLLGLLCREASAPNIRSILRDIREEAGQTGIAINNGELLAILEEERSR